MNGWEKVIYWEIYKELKCDHTTKWYTHKPETVQENETHEILWDFEIQINPLIPAKTLDRVLIKKKKERKNNNRTKKRTFGGFCCSCRPQSKNKRKQKKKKKKK